MARLQMTAEDNINSNCLSALQNVCKCILKIKLYTGHRDTDNNSKEKQQRLP